MSQVQLSRYLSRIERLKKELEVYETLDSSEAICQSIIDYTEKIDDPLVPGQDNSKNPWVYGQEGDPICACTMF